MSRPVGARKRRRPRRPRPISPLLRTEAAIASVLRTSKPVGPETTTSAAAPLHRCLATRTGSASNLLRDGELSVNQITERLGTSQQNASKHLGLLSQAGIVACRKEGTSSSYCVADTGVYELCEQVCGGLRQQLAELRALVEETRRTRSGRSTGSAAAPHVIHAPCSSRGR